MIGVDATSFLVIVASAAVAGLAVTLVGPRVAIPVVVVELVLGILVGPHVAMIAQVDPASRARGPSTARGGARRRLGIRRPSRL